jgi:hypothetical protein
MTRPAVDEEAGELTLECCPGCVDPARLVARLRLEVSATKLVLQRAGLIPDRAGR